MKKHGSYRLLLRNLRKQRDYALLVKSASVHFQDGAIRPALPPTEEEIQQMVADELAFLDEGTWRTP